MTNCMKPFNEACQNFLALVETSEFNIVDKRRLEESLNKVALSVASIKDCPELSCKNVYNDVMSQVSEVGHQAATLQLDITELVNQQQTLTERAPALAA